MIKSNSPETRQSRERISHFRAVRIGVATLVAAATVAGGIEAADALLANTNPVFSTNTTEYVIQPNQGLLDAAMRINGISTIDSAAAVDDIKKLNPEAASHELYPGEKLKIPISVKR
jgi:Tfp pilus assembly protein FimV